MKKVWFEGGGPQLRIVVTHDDASETALVARATKAGQPLTGGAPVKGSSEVWSILDRLRGFGDTV